MPPRIAACKSNAEGEAGECALVLFDERDPSGGLDGTVAEVDEDSVSAMGGGAGMSTGGACGMADGKGGAGLLAILGEGGTFGAGIGAWGGERGGCGACCG